MKPDELTTVFLRVIGILLIVFSPIALLTGEAGPILIAIYQFVIGLVFVRRADSIVALCCREWKPRRAAVGPSTTE